MDMCNGAPTADAQVVGVAGLNQLTGEEKALQAEGKTWGKNNTLCRRKETGLQAEQLSERLQNESLCRQKWAEEFSELDPNHSGLSNPMLNTLKYILQGIAFQSFEME